MQPPVLQNYKLAIYLFSTYNLVVLELSSTCPLRWVELGGVDRVSISINWVVERIEEGC